ncbi:MAG TPA: Gfo/Idh/MocA family oxidoreductase [Acidisoma sp.]|uniref:Gfo/Idh/MocA family protein n=1 Tax=Acidisoma sp. TaxID=1872115 RepID=UPI002BF98D6B|nr:Gfo/Idh/MocA family oxidoreductase [Acidisoma sp.]HTI03303.1 Gfo/Idh/MocA family oxidoreductase [Acidisoma sp.]
MTPKEDRRLRIGVLGCGPIAQFAHFESCTKASNADLYAICDVAEDLRTRMAATHAPEKTFAEYDAMLADPDVEAVIIATSDAFHVPASLRALEAGKHVLCEKPIGVSVEEVEQLRDAAARAGRILQIGHMKRFDPGLQAAKTFVDTEMGEVLALKAWYCDSTHRYTMTDAVQPLPVTSKLARKPGGNPKADLRRYYMLAHGSHLLDLARWLCGPITEVRARLSERFGAYCWFVDTTFANGTLGHLDLTVAVRMDWHEGLQLYGQNGSVVARTFNPWYFRSSEVDIFHEKDATVRKPLGADGHFYRRQVEGFAETILTGKTQLGADAEDGVANIRAMVAIARSVTEGRAVRLDEVAGAL